MRKLAAFLPLLFMGAAMEITARPSDLGTFRVTQNRFSGNFYKPMYNQRQKRKLWNQNPSIRPKSNRR